MNPPHCSSSIGRGTHFEAAGLLSTVQGGVDRVSSPDARRALGRRTGTHAKADKLKPPTSPANVNHTHALFVFYCFRGFRVGVSCFCRFLGGVGAGAREVGRMSRCLSRSLVALSASCALPPGCANNQKTEKQKEGTQTTQRELREGKVCVDCDTSDTQNANPTPHFHAHPGLHKKLSTRRA